MTNFAIDTIILEGIDKTGKDTLVQYIDRVCNHRYAIYQRGNISNIAYERIFNRQPQQYKYNMYRHALYVLLTADLEDLKIRFKLSNEPYTDIERDSIAFKTTFDDLTDGYYTAEYNTSEMTAYQIAKDIVSKVDQINNIK